LSKLKKAQAKKLFTGVNNMLASSDHGFAAVVHEIHLAGATIPATLASSIDPVRALRTDAQANAIETISDAQGRSPNCELTVTDVGNDWQATSRSGRSA